MAETTSVQERAGIFRACTHFLNGHPRRRPREVLEELAGSTDPDARAESYESGKLIEDFEKRIAEFLGFTSAVFMPSEAMARPIAMRIWSDRKRVRNVAFHPTSHLELHEHKAYSAVHGLNGVLLGQSDRPLTLAGAKLCGVPLAAILLELLQREIGGTLPEWEELTAFSAWAPENGIALHMDGARLWEAKPYYGREYSEIARLFDSVYVSFYKGLGGIAGAMLVGDEKFIAEARIWQRRQGGNLVTLFPYVFSAQQSFDARIGKMNLYRDKAVEVAKLLSAFPEVTVTPDPPRTNMMHVFVRAPLEKLDRAALEIARDERVAVFERFRATQVPGTQMLELSIGDSAFELSEARLAALFARFFSQLKT